MANAADHPDGSGIQKYHRKICYNCHTHSPSRGLVTNVKNYIDGRSAIFLRQRRCKSSHSQRAGNRKIVDAIRARRQWHAMAKALIELTAWRYSSFQPHEQLSGLVYPANAGFLYPLERVPADRKTFTSPIFYLLGHGARGVSDRLFSRLELYQRVQATIRGRGRFHFRRALICSSRTGGSNGNVSVLAFGLPPWKRIYGFRSDAECPRANSRRLPRIGP